MTEPFEHRTMKLIATTLQHKIYSPKVQSVGKPPALILLHGRGADESDLLGLAEYLDNRLFCISARAPFAFHGGSGYTWYDVLEVGKPEPKMFSQSYRSLVQFCEDVKNGYGLDPSKIFLMGFSMGTMMAYSIALTLPHTVAGVIANSGYIPEGTDLAFQWEKLHGISFFVGHGVYDPVIPVAFGKRAKELLEQAGVEISYHEYDMGHQINEESLYDISRWLKSKLDNRMKIQRNEP